MANPYHDERGKFTTGRGSASREKNAVHARMTEHERRVEAMGRRTEINNLSLSAQDRLLSRAISMTGDLPRGRDRSLRSRVGSVARALVGRRGSASRGGQVVDLRFPE